MLGRKEIVNPVNFDNSTKKVKGKLADLLSYYTMVHTSISSLPNFSHFVEVGCGLCNLLNAV